MYEVARSVGGRRDAFGGSRLLGAGNREADDADPCANSWEPNRLDMRIRGSWWPGEGIVTRTKYDWSEEGSLEVCQTQHECGKGAMDVGEEARVGKASGNQIETRGKKAVAVRK